MKVLGLVIGAVVLGLMILTVVQRVTAARDEVPVVPISADDAYALDGPLTCESELNEVPHLPLEAEPIALLVCADPEGSSLWVSPDDLVEGDLTPLVDSLAGLEPTPEEPYDCTFQGGPAYDLLLRFSRDRYARVHGDTGGCGVVSVASADFLGADEVLDAALALVEDQRDRMPPPSAVPARPDCPDYSDVGPAYSLTGEVDELVVAVSCWRPDKRKPPEFSDPVPVPTRQLRVLVADMRENSEPIGMPGEHYDCPGGLDELYSQVLVGRTAWGDLVEVSGQCHEFYLDVWAQRPGSEPPRMWLPSPRAQRILDGLRR